MSTLRTLRIIGEEAGECFVPMPFKFFTELTNSMYPKNKHRREWALSNLELFYNNRRDEINTIAQVKKEHG